MAFDFWKKKTENNAWSPIKASPLGYWEERSYMSAVPEVLPLETWAQVEERLGMIPGAIVTAFKDDEENHKKIFTVFYEGEEYRGEIEIGEPPQVPQNPQMQKTFTQEEMERLQNAKFCLTVSMKFGQKPFDAYHLQLKILTTLVPDLIMVYDESAERMLSGRWAKMAAASKYTPGPKDLFQVHAVQGKDGRVWLHSHGLCRCNLTELEVLNSDFEHYEAHYNVLATLAGMMLADGVTEKKGGFLVGMLADNIAVYVTTIPWTQALSEYPGISMGGLDDRREGHNSKYSVIFLYKTPADQANDVRSRLSVYDDLWDKNPLFYYSNAETERMSLVARERFDIAKRAFARGSAVLVKIGLPVDDGDVSEREHIWFELKSVEERGFIATLTQEPYNVSGIHTGDDRFLTVDDITDWVVMSEELRMQVAPDRAYLLE